MNFPARALALVIAAVVSSITVVVVGPFPAAADRIADKKAEAEQIARDLARDARRVSELTEQMNAARLGAERLAEAVRRAETEAARAQERVHLVQDRLRRQAADAYVHGGSLQLVGVLAKGNSELTRFSVRAEYARSATSAAIDTLDEYREERARLLEQQAQLDASRVEAQTAVSAAEARHADARDAVARQKQTLARVQGELTELVAAEQRRRAEEEARRVRAELEARRREAAAREAAAREAAAREAAARDSARRQTATPTAVVEEGATARPPAPGAGAAVAEAKEQLGKPYEYGADGPDSFDCSGLTQWAWKAGGRYLPHSSRAQWDATSRVSLADIQPGDITFYGPSVSGIHHVGIYVGDGQMIEASETGTPVRYASVYRRDMVGIGRVN